MPFSDTLRFDPEREVDIDKMSKSHDVYVIYHGGCRDGFTAAWTVYHLFCLIPIPHKVTVHLIPENHGFRATKKLLEDIKAGEVLPAESSLLFADICPHGQNGKYLHDLRNAGWIVFNIIDHHKTTIDEFGEWPEFLWDLKESGASLAWSTLQLPSITGNPMPELHKLVRSLDIHRKDYPHEDELGLATELIQRKLNPWNELFVVMEDATARQALIEQGTLLKTYRSKLLSTILRAARPYKVKLDGQLGLACNSPVFSTMLAGAVFRKRLTKMLISYSFNGEFFYLSLRSTDDGPDCQAIAKKYGGGGHARAAGLRTKSLEDVNFEILGELTDSEFATLVELVHDSMHLLIEDPLWVSLTPNV